MYGPNMGPQGQLQRPMHKETQCSRLSARMVFTAVSFGKATTKHGPGCRLGVPKTARHWGGSDVLTPASQMPMSGLELGQQ